MSINALVKEIKENNEDFEWYPTTQEIVDALYNHLVDYLEVHWRNHIGKVLDIGCGNGGFFDKFCHDKFETVRKYGIEKSNILAEQLPDDVILLGSDFTMQTLIDKKVDMIFCNPPYSEYDVWTEKIINEANCNVICLVIPSRWKDNDRIKESLEARKMQATVIGSYDFENAERKARAKVDLLFISPRVIEFRGKRVEETTTNPFDMWFENTFKIKAVSEKVYDFSYNEKVKEQLNNEIIAHGGTAEMLVKFYNDDMEKLYGNYKKLEELDPELFQELKIDIINLKKALQERLTGLKHIYWDMLFKKYDKVTNRLTSSGRKSVIDRLNDNTAIDFNMPNIVQLTLWMIRHSNTLFDQQITDYFYQLCNSDSIRQYKSNQRWTEDQWKYLKDTMDSDMMSYSEKQKALRNAQFIKLDYRIIVKSWSNFETNWTRKFSSSCRDFLHDTIVIGNNLGFNIDFQLPDIYEDICLSDWNNFDIMTTDGKLFANVKLYKNGNRHIKFCKEFMQKLNVEMARINGWIQDKSQAAEEMEVDNIDTVWNSNFSINVNNSSLLGLPCLTA